MLVNTYHLIKTESGNVYLFEVYGCEMFNKMILN